MNDLHTYQRYHIDDSDDITQISPTVFFVEIIIVPGSKTDGFVCMPGDVDFFLDFFEPIRADFFEMWFHRLVSDFIGIGPVEHVYVHYLKNERIQR